MKDSSETRSLDYVERQREAVRRRYVTLHRTGARHTEAEIQELLKLQESRCIYCNLLIGDGVSQASRDHLLPVQYGGGDWAVNILMACRSCNCRRGSMPFRTFCTLLSPRQNRIIAMRLCARLGVIDLDKISDAAWKQFCVGLALHDPAHLRYRLILRNSRTARRNAKLNSLLPDSPESLVAFQTDRFVERIAKLEKQLSSLASKISTP
jgi:5-methylcytosine-specific restriction endonuclease McrA